MINRFQPNPHWARMPLFDRSNWERVCFGEVVGERQRGVRAGRGRHRPLHGAAAWSRGHCVYGPELYLGHYKMGKARYRPGLLKETMRALKRPIQINSGSSRVHEDSYSSVEENLRDRRA